MEVIEAPLVSPVHNFLLNGSTRFNSIQHSSFGGANFRSANQEIPCCMDPEDLLRYPQETATVFDNPVQTLTRYI
jgi:hypothetical protein